MKKFFVMMAVLLCLVTLAGCSGNLSGTSEEEKESKIDDIQFGDEQLYAVAYLGYEEMEDLSFYAENYLDSENLPVHYISKGEFYLIIPRYTDMSMRLYKNDFETTEPILIYEEGECCPFIIQCNVSDIFPNATICLTYQKETAEFSPYISLKDGSVEVGERGLNITRTTE